MAPRVELHAVADDARERAWLEVFNAVAPERAATLEETRHTRAVAPHRLDVLGLVDGQPAAHGSVEVDPLDPDRSHLYADVLVRREARGRGVGAALHDRLLGWARAEGRAGLEVLVVEGAEEGARFAARRGYRETEREMRVALDLAGRQPPVPAPPAGVAVTTYAERPQLARGIYDVAAEALPDIPAEEPYHAGPFEKWREVELEGPGHLPEACFLAVAGEEVVGYAQLILPGARPGVAQHGLTAVRRAWRGLGLARTLKEAQIAWAIGAGLRVLETENEARNAPMRAVNARLGYEPMPAWIYLRGPAA